MINCPNCGAKVSQKMYAETTCPYCKGVIPPVRQAKPMESISPKFIITFDLEDDRFYTKFIQALVDEEDASCDIFDNLSLGKIQKSCVPFYYFEGEFSAPWSCSVGYSVERQRRNKEGKLETHWETEWHPASGVAAGNFEYLVPAAHEDKQSLPYMLEYALSFSPFTPKNLESFDSDMLNPQENIVDITLTSETAWSKGNVNYDLGDRAEEAAKMQLPSNGRYRDFHFSMSRHIHKTILGYASIWYTGFKYKKEEFGYALSGFNYFVDAPQGRDVRRDPQIRQLKKKLGYKPWVLTSISLFILCVFLFFNGSVYKYMTESLMWVLTFMGIVLPIAILIGSYFFNESVKSQISERTAEIRAHTRSIRLASAKTKFKKYAKDIK